MEEFVLLFVPGICKDMEPEALKLFRVVFFKPIDKAEVENTLVSLLFGKSVPRYLLAEYYRPTTSS